MKRAGHEGPPRKARKTCPPHAWPPQSTPWTPWTERPKTRARTPRMPPRRPPRRTPPRFFGLRARKGRRRLTRRRRKRPRARIPGKPLLGGLKLLCPFWEKKEPRVFKVKGFCRSGYPHAREAENAFRILFFFSLNLPFKSKTPKMLWFFFWFFK